MIGLSFSSVPPRLVLDRLIDGAVVLGVPSIRASYIRSEYDDRRPEIDRLPWLSVRRPYRGCSSMLKTSDNLFDHRKV